MTACLFHSSVWLRAQGCWSQGQEPHPLGNTVLPPPPSWFAAMVTESLPHAKESPCSLAGSTGAAALTWELNGCCCSIALDVRNLPLHAQSVAPGKLEERDQAAS